MLEEYQSKRDVSHEAKSDIFECLKHFSSFAFRVFFINAH